MRYWRYLLYSTIVLIGILLRFINIDTQTLTYDEAHFFATSIDINVNGTKYWDASEQPPGLAFINSLWLKVTENSITQFRIISLIFGLVNIILMFYYLKKTNKNSLSLLFSLTLITISPFIVTVDRWHHGESFHLFCILIILLCLEYFNLEKLRSVIFISFLIAISIVYIKLLIGMVIYSNLIACFLTKRISFKFILISVCTSFSFMIIFCILSFPYAPINLLSWGISGQKINGIKEIAYTYYKSFNTMIPLASIMILLFASKKPKSILNLFKEYYWLVLTLLLVLVFFSLRLSSRYVYLISPFYLLLISVIIKNYLESKISYLYKIIIAIFSTAIVLFSFTKSYYNYINYLNSDIDFKKIGDLIVTHNYDQKVYINTDFERIGIYLGFNQSRSIRTTGLIDSLKGSNFYFNTTSYNLKETAKFDKQKLVANFFNSKKQGSIYKLYAELLTSLENENNMKQLFVRKNIFENINYLKPNSLLLLLPEPTDQNDGPIIFDLPRFKMNEFEYSFSLIKQKIRIIQKIESKNMKYYGYLCAKN